MSQRDIVLLNIVRCAGSDRPTPRFASCAAVVREQQSEGPPHFQVPEPWRGDIVNAPLLFVSSNPGYDRNDDCPTADQSDQAIIDYYVSGFPLQFPWNVTRDGVAGKYVPFWGQMRSRAAELYGRPATSLRSGVDFALTEVVHCKSRSEGMARVAAKDCMALHFGPLATLSQAAVVVVFGNTAADAISIPKLPAVENRQWYGRSRLLMWLPHPNARKPRRVCDLYGPEDVARVQAVLNDVRNVNCAAKEGQECTRGVCLPAPPQPREREIGTGDGASRVQNPAVPNARIIWLDDDPSVLEIGELLLRRAGYRHITCLTDDMDSEALAFLRREPPDLLLHDILHRGLGGIDFYRALKSDENLRRIPVIIVSSAVLSHQRFVEECRTCFGDECLAKPFVLKDLLAAIVRMLSRHHLPEGFI